MHCVPEAGHPTDAQHTATPVDAGTSSREQDGATAEGDVELPDVHVHPRFVGVQTMGAPPVAPHTLAQWLAMQLAMSFTLDPETLLVLTRLEQPAPRPHASTLPMSFRQAYLSSQQAFTND